MNEADNVNIPFNHFWKMATEAAELYALRTHLKILMSSDTSNIVYKEEIAKICGIDLEEVRE